MVIDYDALAKANGGTTVKPVAAPGAIDYAALAKQNGGTTVTPAPAPAVPATTPTPAPDQGVLGNLWSGIKNAFSSRVNTAADAQIDPKNTVPGKILDTVGQGAGLVNDIAGKAVTAANAATAGIVPKAAAFVAKEVAPVIPGAGVVKNAADVAKAAIGAPEAQQAIETVKQHLDAMRAAHPEAAGHLDAIGNILSLLPIDKVATLGTKAAIEAAPIVAKGAADAAMAAPAAVKTAATTGAKAAVVGGSSIATGVPKEVLERAADPAHASRIEQAVNHLAENEKQPFLDVAQRSAAAIKNADTIAATKLSQAKQEFKAANPKAEFDIHPKIPQIVAALKPFRSSGLIVDKAANEAGRTVDYSIGKTAQSPFSPREISALNGLLGKMKASKGVNVDDLLALRQSFNAAYDEIPLGVNGTPKPYHAAVMALKGAAEPAIDQILPPQLKSAFKDYRQVEDMKGEIGNRISNPDGTVKDTAEQFLANLPNLNKGNLRASADRLRQLTGLDLNSEIQAVKDAQKLSPLFASTGSRTQDILRALLVSSLGTAVAGPFGTAAGLAATSPRLAGKAALSIGKYLAKRGGQSDLIPSAEAISKNMKKPSTAISRTLSRKGPIDIFPDEPPF